MTSGEREVPVGIALIGLAAVVAAWLFFSGFAPAGFVVVRWIPALCITLAVLLAAIPCARVAFAISRRLVSRAGESSDDAQDQPLADLVLCGVPLFGSLIALSSVCGIPLLVGTTLLTAVLAAAGALLLFRSRAVLLPREFPRAGALLGIPLTFALIGALMPVSSPDELIYKLGTPHAYLMFDAMLELPLASHSYLGGALSLASVAPLALSGGTAARLLHLALWLATIVVIYRLGERLLAGSGRWCCAVFAWTPALMLISGWAWAEWAVLGLLLLSLDRWLAFVDDAKAHDAAVAFVALAAAVSVKYTALPWIAVFALVAALRMRRSGRRWLPLGMAGIATLALFGSIFLARNMIWTGSPLAPLFLPGAPAIGGYMEDNGWRALIRGDLVFDRRIIDEALGIVLPVSVIASLFAFRRHRFGLDLLLLGGIQSAILITFAPLPRLLVAGLAPLALLGAVESYRLFSASPRALRAVLSLGAGIALLAQGAMVAFILHNSYEPLGYLTGQETESQYLGRMRSYAAIYDWIEEHTEPSATLLVLGENRIFHLDRKSIAATNGDGPRISAWLASFRTPAELEAELRRQRVTHVLIYRKWYRVASPEDKPLSAIDNEYLLRVPAAADATMRELLRTRARLVYDERGYELYEIAGTPGQDRTMTLSPVTSR